MAAKDWIWMPHPGHFIGGFDCRFSLNTRVGNVIVSTVGEYFPDSAVRRVFADSRGISIEGIGDARKFDYMRKVGWEEIGCGRTYETMVFKAHKVDEICCPYRADVTGGELDFGGYNNAGDAFEGHMDMCKKWDRKKVKK